MGHSISREIPNQADWKDIYRSCAEKTPEAFRFKFACTWTRLHVAHVTCLQLILILMKPRKEPTFLLEVSYIIYHASSHKVEDRLYRRLHHDHQGDGYELFCWQLCSTSELRWIVVSVLSSCLAGLCCKVHIRAAHANRHCRLGLFGPLPLCRNILPPLVIVLVRLYVVMYFYHDPSVSCGSLTCV